jgi:hypothetical protein
MTGVHKTDRYFTTIDLFTASVYEAWGVNLSETKTNLITKWLYVPRNQIRTKQLLGYFLSACICTAIGTGGEDKTDSGFISKS